MTGFVTVDVFTRLPFGGNPLAVVPDARSLDPAEFQRIARAFNLSETTFVLPPQDPANDACVRIFTPTEELPFAGHPNVGTAFALARAGSVLGRPIGDALRFEEGAGLVVVQLERADNCVTGASVRAPQPLKLGPVRKVEHVAAMAGIEAAQILGGWHQPGYASVGTGFLFAEVTASGLAASRPRLDGFEAEAARLAGEGWSAALPALFLWAAAGHDGDTALLDARMFAPLSGIVEDPATGSAAAALAALLAARGMARRFAIAQGVAMGRPSAIRVRLDDAGVWVSGDCVAMTEGRLIR